MFKYLTQHRASTWHGPTSGALGFYHLLENQTKLSPTASLQQLGGDLPIGAGIARVGLELSFISCEAFLGPLVELVTRGLLQSAYCHQNLVYITTCLSCVIWGTRKNHIRERFYSNGILFIIRVVKSRRLWHLIVMVHGKLWTLNFRMKFTANPTLSKDQRNTLGSIFTRIRGGL